MTTAAAPVPLWFAIVSGTAGSVIARLTEAPFARCKHVMHAHPELVRQGRRLGLPAGWRETDLLPAVQHIVQTEGALGLLRGTAAGVLAALPTTLLSYLLHDMYSAWAARLAPDGNASFTAPLVAVTTMALTYPLQLAHAVQMAEVLDPERGHVAHAFPSMNAVWDRTVQYGGVPGLFSGFAAGAAHAWLHRAISMFLWNELKPRTAHPTNTEVIIHVTVTAVVATLVTHPLDTIRRRMMIAAPTPLAFSNSLECALTIWREEGLYGFFRGVIFSVLRSLVSTLTATYADKLIRLVFPNPGPL